MEIARELLYRGADVHARTMVTAPSANSSYTFTSQFLQRHWTPLIMAVSNGWKEVAELLLEFGADVNARDKVQSDSV